jgi:hypothetical protein
MGKNKIIIKKMKGNKKDGNTPGYMIKSLYPKGFGLWINGYKNIYLYGEIDHGRKKSIC